ncbi:zinc finger and BTB domain-containing protein 14-like isoform X2 [Syngnathus typhle]|uniref:zinc finger and BTB domain-containing protein 14-like isoform X2 n=1 Tax=Syngnathus typhle TaxID=161592 RepID=UPI002A6A7D65|nr:zinc finger and BTB domain-containing protein 14-like isoform X2 [Syngnathus typhle]
MSELLRYIDYDHKATFLKMLNQQRMEGEHCDVVVVVENIEFRAHRCVLAACSNYFKKLFKKQTDEDNSIVELDFIRSDIFEEKRELTNMKTRENQAPPGDHGLRAQDAILKELAMEEVRKNSFYDTGMDGMGGAGASHVPQPHGYNTGLSKDPHTHGWGSSASSDMKLEYLLYGHRDHGSLPGAGAKPLEHSAKKERLLTANRPYGCEHCPKAFTTAAHLKEHLKIHSGFKPHRCVVCGKAFIRGPDLKRHERVHSNERPFACQLCEKAFKHKSHLKDHERQHRGERPFNCGSCDKAFIKASDLKRHWNTMHSGNPRRQMALSPGASQHAADDQRDWKLEAAAAAAAHSHNSDC